MEKQHVGRPLKGKKRMSGAERQARYKKRVDIILDELKHAGVEPQRVFVPPVYLEALQTLEDSLNSRPNVVDSVIKGSGWLCTAIEQFLLKHAEVLPNSELAKLVNGPDWVSRQSLDFETAAMSAKARIYLLEKEFQNDDEQER